MQVLSRRLHARAHHGALLSPQVRAALLLARRLQRILILPKLVCGLDRFWAPHNGTIPGSDTMLPIDPCPADHVLDLEHMARTLVSMVHLMNSDDHLMASDDFRCPLMTSDGLRLPLMAADGLPHQDGTIEGMLREYSFLDNPRAPKELIASRRVLQVRSPLINLDSP